MSPSRVLTEIQLMKRIVGEIRGNFPEISPCATLSRDDKRRTVEKTIKDGRGDIRGGRDDKQKPQRASQRAEVVEEMKQNKKTRKIRSRELQIGIFF